MKMASDNSLGPPRRTIKRLLVANRGEIAKRVIDCARELSIETFALVTPGDTSHALAAAHLLSLPSAASYLDISALVGIVKEQRIDAVHPGYGFHSESAEFARRMWDEAGVVVIGPGWDILSKTGDKLAAKLLARSCDVPTLPFMAEPTSQVQDVWQFAREIGFPIMLKAVDGGGGKGIRLVRQESELESATKRAIAESPSRQIFAEKAAIDGFRHIEVQIVGDGSGQVRHLWERECSIQRRYQKIIEQAPSTIPDRAFIGNIIEAAIRMAQKVKYLSLGTIEFLANPDRDEFFFLEVNPRLQVEHTVTESIALVDLVRIQLEIAQGAKLDETEIRYVPLEIMQPPKLKSIQLRLTAENVQRDWSLNIGRIQSFSLPTGHGVRVDTHLTHSRTTVISADYDSLLAKIIVTCMGGREVINKCRRALEDTWIDGVKTNLDVLRAIVVHEDFKNASCDTSWLEKNVDSLVTSGLEMSSRITSKHKAKSPFAGDAIQLSPVTSNSSSAVLLRKGDAWVVKLASPSQPSLQETQHIKLTRVIRNEFPSSFRAEIEYSHTGSQQPQALILEATSSNASSAAIMAEGKHRRGDSNNPLHVVVPFAGKLVEITVDEGDMIKPGQVVCVVQQMKMELEIRAARGGKVKWITDAQDGEDIAEGTLAAELEDLKEEVESRARL
ncbi:hypothetical protein F5Y19DRAFT_455559 [Xylariaceae sp. FL1651]|nr:hypothetical protein F5Y19DRAFT_455559 [Xylariaceae sp. FL1651]